MEQNNLLLSYMVQFAIISSMKPLYLINSTIAAPVTSCYIGVGFAITLSIDFVLASKTHWLVKLIQTLMRQSNRW